MKITTRSPHILHLGQLLGLALIGFVLWLAAIGWLWIAPAKVVPAELRHGNPETRLAHMPTEQYLPPSASSGAKNTTAGAAERCLSKSGHWAVFGVGC